MKAFGPRTISTPTGDIQMLDLALTKEKTRELYDSGYQSAKAFFDTKPDGRNTFGAVPANVARGR